MATRFPLSIFLFLLCGMFSISTAQIHISGPQSGILIDTVYIVDGGISVAQGNSLTIEPGAIFLVDGAYSIEIQGVLLAIGTESDSIIFRPNSGVTAWSGIKFAYGSSDFCILRYCLVEGSNDHGILISGCSPTIDHCTIRWNIGSGWGGAIYVSTNDTRHPVISNCLITENSGDVGGGIGVFPGRVSISNCIITRNWSQIEGGGINLEMSVSQASIDHCLIAHNTSGHGGGIFLCTGAKATIANCTIVANSIAPHQVGGGIGIGGNSKAHIVNVMVAYNMGDGISLANRASKIEYCCFYHNAGTDFTGYFPDSLGLLTMVNTNGDSCDIYHNLILNPLFVNLQNHDYHLQANSPCIDAGDPRIHLDPDSTIADIGAYYFDQGRFTSLQMDSWQPLQFGVLTNYPNPFNAFTQISYSLPNASQVELTISNILGQRIATLINGIQPTGTHTITWDAGNVTSGIYFARLQSREKVKTIKMVLLK